MRALIAAALVAVAMLVVTGGRAELPSAHAEWTTTLLEARELDIGPRGHGTGDVSLSRWRLTDRNGRAVGFAYQNCRWMTAMVRSCLTVYSPPGGTIVVAGMVGDQSALAVIGGTGTYFGARGAAVREGRRVRFAFV